MTGATRGGTGRRPDEPALAVERLQPSRRRRARRLRGGGGVVRRHAVPLPLHGENEPEWLTGLEDELPPLAHSIAEHGGEDARSAEALFTRGLLLEFRPALGADTDVARQLARAWLASAAEREPASRLFREWRFLVGDPDRLVGARVYAEAEVHARSAARGALGAYLVHTLRARLLPDGSAPTAS